jgi:hypothetical protein
MEGGGLACERSRLLLPEADSTGELQGPSSPSRPEAHTTAAASTSPLCPETPSPPPTLCAGRPSALVNSLGKTSVPTRLMPATK